MNKRPCSFFLVATAALLVLFIVAIYFMGAHGSKRDLFDIVSGSISSNTNFNKVIIWARETLKQTNNLPESGYFEIEKEKYPEVINGLYQGPNAHVTVPHVYIYKSEGDGHYIAIKYSPGSTYFFAIFIGDKNFEIPIGRVKKYLKHENGVFITGDW